MSNTQNKRRKTSENTFWVAVGLAAASGVTMLFTLLIAESGTPTAPVLRQSAPASSPSVASPVSKGTVASPNARMAERIERRLKNRDLPTPNVAVLSAALSQRRALLGREITVTLATTDGSIAPAPATARLADHPDWLILETTPWSAQFTVAPASVRGAIDRGDIAGLQLLRHSEVVAMERDFKNVLRASASAVAKAGYAVDEDDAASAIASALNDGIDALQLEAAYAEPSVTVSRPDGTTVTLPLLSTGLSDYSNSPPGRIHNVFKAINERVNNVVLEKNETFSLVDVLDAPITIQKGWMEEMGLFGGGAALTPGAGICQSATTLYRAAILAGLPLVSKRSHSLFVDHYEFYGIGLDATVFPGVQDLQFKNDTNDLLVIQAYIEGDIVHVNFFGEPDGRSVALDGPYFMRTPHRPASIPPLSIKQIGWSRTITYGDGRTKTEPLIANYAKPLWNSLMKKYDVVEGVKLLTQRESTSALDKIAAAKAAEELAAHAAAPEEPVVKADVVGQ